jgi:hypothetical protein
MIFELYMLKSKFMKRYLLTLVAICFISIIHGQTIENEDISITKTGFKEKKFFNDNKRVYINSFLIYNEVYREDQDTKSGGSGIGSMVKGKATVVQTLGLSGIQAADLQAVANQLYDEFVDALKAEGFDIINSEEAGNTKTYEGWQLVEGPIVKDAGIPGVLSVVPEGHSYFIRGVDKQGRDVKSKGLGKLMEQKGGGNTGNAFSNSASLSKQLNDAVVVDVQLSYLFTQEGDNWLRGNSAKVIVKTNFRLGSGVVSKLNDSNSLVRVGSEKVDRIDSHINFARGKFSAGAESVLQTSIKKDVYINGVINSERIASSESQDIVYPTSFNTYKLGNDFYTNVEKRSSVNTNWIEVDSQKYAEGMLLAGKKYIDTALEEFRSKK